MTVLAFIKTLFRFDPVTSKAAGAQGTGEQTACLDCPQTQPPSTSDNGIAEFISAQGSSSKPLLAGSFELVGLDEIKEALGPRWADLAARASNLAELGIRRRLSDGDVLQALSETEFAICFANLDGTAAVKN